MKMILKCATLITALLYFGLLAQVLSTSLPWTVRLQAIVKNQPIRCAATLISRQWLITSRHCVIDPETNEKASGIIAIFGLYDLRNKGSDPGEQTRSITDENAILLHPYYDEATPVRYDFALVKLSPPVDVTDYVAPIALPDVSLCQTTYTATTSPVDSCNKALIAGWGGTGANRNTPTMLKNASLTINSFDLCQEVGSRFYDTRICASRRATACIGDVGGPLMCVSDNDNKPNYLLGVITHGDGEGSCTPGGAPSVHNRICTILSWILDKVGEDQVKRYPELAAETQRKCRAVPKLQNGVIEDGLFDVGSYRILTCNEGYHFTGDDDVIMCQTNGMWSQPTGSCVSEVEPPPTTTAAQQRRRNTCGTVPTIENGKVGSGNSDVGDYRKVTCNAGYHYSNDNEDVISCQRNGYWTEPGRCTRDDPTTCGAVPTMKNGEVLDGFSEIGDDRRIECSNGYRYDGSSDTITCQRNGYWSQPGKCVRTRVQPTTCGELPTIDNGQISTGSSVIGANRVVTCKTGYRYNGDHILCLDDGTWSQAGRCVRVSGVRATSTTKTTPTTTTVTTNCGSVPPVPNGMVSRGQFNVGSNRRVSCRANYQFDGDDNSIVCQSNGEWSSVRGSCVQIKVATTKPPPSPCPSEFPGVANGEIDDNHMLICDSGYQLSGEKDHVKCDDGVWVVSGMCTPIDCGEPPPIKDGSRSAGSTTFGSTTFGSTRSISCNTGFLLLGPVSIRCEATGLWSKGGVCQFVQQTCPNDVPNVEHGSIAEGGRNVGDTRDIICEKGYELNRDAVRFITCGESGEWSKPERCIPQYPIGSCGFVPRVTGGSFPNGRNNIGARRKLYCYGGFSLASEIGGEIECKPDGTWTKPGICVRTSCPNVELVTLKNGYIEPGAISLATSRNVQCYPGYQLIGPAAITCQTTGMWTQPGACFQMCDDTPSIAHARVQPGSSVIGSERIVRCTGSASGAFKITCQADGIWSGPSGSCTLPTTTQKPDPTKEPGVVIAIVLVSIIVLAAIVIGIWLCCANKIC